MAKVTRIESAEVVIEVGDDGRMLFLGSERLATEDPRRWRRIVDEVKTVVVRHLNAHRDLEIDAVNAYVRTKDYCEHCEYGWEVIEESWPPTDDAPLGLPACCDKAQEEWWDEHPAAKELRDEWLDKEAAKGPRSVEE